MNWMKMSPSKNELLGVSEPTNPFDWCLTGLAMFLNGVLELFSWKRKQDEARSST
jgi:hypothetical protein